MLLDIVPASWSGRDRLALGRRSVRSATPNCQPIKSRRPLRAARVTNWDDARLTPDVRLPMALAARGTAGRFIAGCKWVIGDGVSLRMLIELSVRASAGLLRLLSSRVKLESAEIGRGVELASA